MMKHSLFSQDLILCDFKLFPLLKHELCDWNFEMDAEMIQENQKIFGRILKKEFETTIKK